MKKNSGNNKFLESFSPLYRASERRRSPSVAGTKQTSLAKKLNLELEFERRCTSLAKLQLEKLKLSAESDYTM